QQLHVFRASASRVSGHACGRARQLDLKDPAIPHHVSLEPVLDLALVDPQVPPTLAVRAADPGDAKAAEMLSDRLVVVAWTGRPAHRTGARRNWGATPFDPRHIRAEHRDRAAPVDEVDIPFVCPGVLDDEDGPIDEHNPLERLAPAGESERGEDQEHPGG